MPTLMHSNSKADTRYFTYGAGSIASLATDYSQYRTNLTTAATYAYEDPSARTSFDKEWCVELIFEWDPGSSGILINHGTYDGVSYTYRISATKGATVVFESTTGPIYIELNIDPGSTKSYLVYWSCRDINETGHTYHECGVYDIAAATWTKEYTTIATSGITTSTSWRLNLGGYGAGTSVYDYGMSAVEMVRIGCRYHSTEEVYLDFVTSTTPDTVTAIRRCGLVPVDTSTTTISDDGSFAGPSLLVAGSACKRNDRRLLSPLLNIRMSPNNLLDYNYSPSTWVRKAIGSTLFRWRHDMMWWRPLPKMVNYARVRIHADHYQLAGTHLPVYLRVYCLDRLPLLNKKGMNNPPPKPIIVKYCGVTIDETSGTPGVGQWYDLGALELAQGWQGSQLGCFFLIAWHVNSDLGDSSEEFQQLRINQVVIEPYTKPPTNGQYGNYDEGQEP